MNGKVLQTTVARIGCVKCRNAISDCLNPKPLNHLSSMGLRSQRPSVPELFPSSLVTLVPSHSALFCAAVLLWLFLIVSPIIAILQSLPLPSAPMFA